MSENSLPEAQDTLAAPILLCAMVSMNFGAVAALSNVSLDVFGGEIAALIGPNGSGKTTMLNCISGVLKPASGRVVIDGKEMTGRPAYVCAANGIARTFQNLRLFVGLSVRENILIGGHLNGSLRHPARRLRARRDLADTLMEAFDLHRISGQLAGSQPYGVQRRVEIARALMTQPRILLLDEPAAGMNHIEAASLGESFRGLTEQGLGVLLVEHNVSLVTSIARRLYVLDAGRNLASGAPDEVMSNEAVVKAYLG